MLFEVVWENKLAVNANNQTVKVPEFSLLFTAKDLDELLPQVKKWSTDLSQDVKTIHQVYLP